MGQGALRRGARPWRPYWAQGCLPGESVNTKNAPQVGRRIQECPVWVSVVRLVGEFGMDVPDSTGIRCAGIMCSLPRTGPRRHRSQWPGRRRQPGGTVRSRAPGKAPGTWT